MRYSPSGAYLLCQPSHLVICFVSRALTVSTPLRSLLFPLIYKAWFRGLGAPRRSVALYFYALAPFSFSLSSAIHTTKSYYPPCTRLVDLYFFVPIIDPFVCLINWD